MSETPLLPRTALRSAQLVAASERTTLDPFVDVDWSVPIDDSAYHLPPEWLPLYGTPAWEAMTEPDRVTYSRHEAAALCGAGIWFENVLMQSVLRHLADLPVTHPAHRFLLVEVADECRHSTMFGEFIRRAGTPAYRPAGDVSGIDGLSGDRASAAGGRAMSYLLILAVEELLDAANRATMKDDRLHPVTRQVARLHVLEEARHVSFAKTYLAEVWPTLTAADREAAVELAPIAVAAIADFTIDPDVYRALEIDDGEAQARANPHHRARITEGLAKLTGFLTEIGVIDDERRPAWEGLGLVA